LLPLVPQCAKRNARLDHVLQPPMR